MRCTRETAIAEAGTTPRMARRTRLQGDAPADDATTRRPQSGSAVRAAMAPR
jgi:hypothetical protein